MLRRCVRLAKLLGRSRRETEVQGGGKAALYNSCSLKRSIYRPSQRENSRLVQVGSEGVGQTKRGIGQQTVRTIWKVRVRSPLQSADAVLRAPQDLQLASVGSMSQRRESIVRCIPRLRIPPPIPGMGGPSVVRPFESSSPLLGLYIDLVFASSIPVPMAPTSQDQAMNGIPARTVSHDLHIHVCSCVGRLSQMGRE